MIFIRICGLTMLLSLLCAAASAQRATEVYITIGESPGVAGSESVVGTITHVEYGEDRMTVSTRGGERTVTITPKTRYYIDRSSEQERSVTGSFEDCREGRRIEAYVDDGGDAVWIKIDAA